LITASAWFGVLAVEYAGVKLGDVGSVLVLAVDGVVLLLAVDDGEL